MPDGFVRWNDSANDLDQNFCAGCSAEHGGFVLQSIQDLLLDSRRAALDARNAPDDPLRMGAENGPKIVLREVPVCDERGAGTTPELRQFVRLTDDVFRQVSAARNR